MTQEQRTRVAQAIQRFHERATTAVEVMNRLDDALDIAPESPLYEAQWALIGGYIEALGAAYAIDGWLEWWWTECLLGEKPMRAKLPGDEEERTIANIDDLVRLILDDLEHAT